MYLFSTTYYMNEYKYDIKAYHEMNENEIKNMNRIAQIFTYKV